MAHFDNENVFNYIIDNVLPFVDSIGLNEQEIADIIYHNSGKALESSYGSQLEFQTFLNYLDQMI